jgi:hypothetical protein
MASMRRRANDWAGAIGILTLLASVAATAPACAAADLLYGGQVNEAGMPVTQDGGNDPGGLPGGAALAAQSGKLDPQRIYGGLRLSDALAVEAIQRRPFGEATKFGDQALSLAGKATLPLTDALSVTGRLGVQYSRSALSSSGPELGDSSGGSPVYGLGLAYEAAEGLELRVESEHVAARSGDPKTVTGGRILFGARLRF